MTKRESNGSEVLASLDVKTLLASVEAAPPIDAAEVVAAALTDALGASDAYIVIANRRFTDLFDWDQRSASSEARCTS